MTSGSTYLTPRIPSQRHAFGKVDEERRNRLQALRPRSRCAARSRPQRVRVSARGEIPTATRAASAAAGSASQTPTTATRGTRAVSSRSPAGSATSLRRSRLVAETARAIRARRHERVERERERAVRADRRLAHAHPRRALAPLDRDRRLPAVAVARCHGAWSDRPQSDASAGCAARPGRARQATRLLLPRAGSASCERAARRR